MDPREVANLFTQHKMVFARQFAGAGAAFQCANCGDRKLIKQGPDGAYYGSRTTVVGPGHDVTDTVPADFDAWCPAAPQTRPDHFDQGTQEGK